jgi:DNA-binding NarL/FixJ family response regulator
VPTRILIADDHDTMRQMLKRTLEDRRGWEVCAEAKDGLEAVQLALEFLPDVVILDFAMPRMNGLHATQNILSVLPGTPILLYTSHASSVLANDAARAGVQQVVSKSVPVEWLIDAIEVALNGKAGEASDGGGEREQAAEVSSASEKPSETQASGQSPSRRRFRTASCSQE